MVTAPLLAPYYRSVRFERVKVTEAVRTFRALTQSQEPARTPRLQALTPCSRLGKATLLFPCLLYYDCLCIRSPSASTPTPLGSSPSTRRP